MKRSWLIIPALLLLIGNEILSLICLCVLGMGGIAALFMGMAEHNN